MHNGNITRNLGESMVRTKNVNAVIIKRSIRSTECVRKVILIMDSLNARPFKLGYGS
jgi:hypothetical protein